MPLTWRYLDLLFICAYDKILSLVWFSAALFKMVVINVVIGSITVRLQVLEYRQLSDYNNIIV